MQQTFYYARTENKADLDKIEAFLDDTFDGFVNRHSDSVDAEFTLSLGLSGRRNRQADSFVGSQKTKTYIKILSYEFADEYVSFRIFSQGKWDIKL